MQFTGRSSGVLALDLECQFRPAKVGDARQRELATGLIRARKLRAKIFSYGLFSDPAWDMLLELYVAELAQQRMTISNLGLDSNIPPTTALRWIEVLQKESLIVRRKDPYDGRRWFVELSEKGSEAMRVWFDSASSSMLEKLAA